jgi:hypothetical protein
MRSQNYSVHLPFIYFTPQNLLDTTITPFRVPVFTVEADGGERVPKMTIKIKEDEGSKTIQLNY